MIPTGVITMWHGLFGDIPPGWAACIGTQGTPDLRTLFVRCAGPGVVVGGPYDSNTHDHELQADEHVHSVVPGEDFHAGPPMTVTIDETVITGTTSTNSHVPENYGLWYIMKIDE